jgi:hypothetical protein
MGASTALESPSDLPDKRGILGDGQKCSLDVVALLLAHGVADICEDLVLGEAMSSL